MSIELAGVTHTYGSGRRVLDNVHILINSGETVAFTGPSGSGKTTLLAIAGLLTRPEAGKVRINGVPVSWRRGDLDRLRARHFGWVFQTANALPRRTALDNAALGLLSGGASHAAARQSAAAALEAVGVAALAQKEARTLSGGELQRVCIARALAARPAFILADEPTGQLDQATTRDVVAALLDGRPQGTGVILATHDMEVAARCERVIAIVNGEAVEQPQ